MTCALQIVHAMARLQPQVSRAPASAVRSAVQDMGATAADRCHPASIMKAVLQAADCKARSGQGVDGWQRGANNTIESTLEFALRELKHTTAALKMCNPLCRRCGTTVLTEDSRSHIGAQYPLCVLPATIGDTFMPSICPVRAPCCVDVERSSCSSSDYQSVRVSRLAMVAKNGFAVFALGGDESHQHAEADTAWDRVQTLEALLAGWEVA